MAIFDQRDTDVFIAILTKPTARRHRNVRFLQQQLGKLQRPEVAQGWRQRRPSKHRRSRRWNGPAGRIETGNQHITPLFIHLANFFDAILRSVQSGGSRDLNGREGAVVQVGLDARQRTD